ncbi:phage tail protein [Paenibacillaceae bacterium]|nr:phage tail protein [Paenibacillaceae bacterium]
MTYKTIQGDQWDIISFKVYGTENGMSLLMQANPSFIETTVFPSGVLLQVPIIQPAAPESIPPWRREE